MRTRMNVLGTGWAITLVLAMIYIVVVLACMLLVGLGTSSSVESFLAGIEWNTIVGFEIGLLGVGMVGFMTAGILVGAGYLVKHWIFRQVDTPQLLGQSVEQPLRSRPIKLYVGCLTLPVLALITLRLLTPIVAQGVNSGVPGVKAKGSDSGIQPVNMGPAINTAFREAEPTFTADGRMMYFNCHNADICVSHLVGNWEEGNWTPPEVIGAPISTEYEEVEPLINPSGDKLYFTSNRPGEWGTPIPFLSPFLSVLEVANTIAMGGIHASILNGAGVGHVWVSYLINGVWSEPRNLKDVPGEPPINSAFHDHCPSFSADGNEVFWTSNRPGGFGANDIWTSRRVNGAWTAPEQLGQNVNSPKDEHHSMPTPDGRSLYITSNRPGGYGGEDIYISQRGDDGKWGPLANLGPLVNGAGDDRCAVLTPDLKIFLFDSVRNGGYGSLDLWWVYFKDVMGDPLAQLP